MHTMKRKRWPLTAILLAYMLTWVFGWRSHSSELSERAGRLWLSAKQSNQEQALLEARDGGTVYPIEIHANGPRTNVKWCFPVLPGILLADSGYSIGPLYGQGGKKIVVFYGFGSAELMTIFGWIS